MFYYILYSSDLMEVYDTVILISRLKPADSWSLSAVFPPSSPAIYTKAHSIYPSLSLFSGKKTAGLVGSQKKNNMLFISVTSIKNMTYFQKSLRYSSLAATSTAASRD